MNKRPYILGMASAFFAAACIALLPAASCGTTAVASIPSAVALTECILNTYATDSAAGLAAAAIASDELAKCGSDAATIASIVAAHEGAAAKEGMVIRNAGAVPAALRAIDGGK